MTIGKWLSWTSITCIFYGWISLFNTKHIYFLLPIFANVFSAWAAGAVVALFVLLALKERSPKTIAYWGLFGNTLSFIGAVFFGAFFFFPH